MILILLALQAASVPSPPSQTPPKTQTQTPQSFSILAPSPCGTRDDKGDIVVCANGASSQALPLPGEREPPKGRGANHDLSAARALDLEGTPCAASQWGCTVGFGPPIVPLAVAAAKAVKSAFARKPDKRGRVAIPLDDPPPAGTLLP